MTKTKMFATGAVPLAVFMAGIQTARATPVTVGRLHSYCLELPDAQNVSRGDVKSYKAAFDAMYLEGYIAGVTDEMNDLAGVGMGFDWPKTNGELVDAVCQYFTLHPEQWSWDASSGVHLAATAMYKKKGK
jgi:Ssp1 endopeptidase immunity protein Rap1a